MTICLKIIELMVANATLWAAKYVQENRKETKSESLICQQHQLCPASLSYLGPVLGFGNQQPETGHLTADGLVPMSSLKRANWSSSRQKQAVTHEVKCQIVAAVWVWHLLHIFETSLNSRSLHSELFCNCQNCCFCNRLILQHKALECNTRCLAAKVRVFWILLVLIPVLHINSSSWILVLVISFEYKKKPKYVKVTFIECRVICHKWWSAVVVFV